MQPVLSRRKVSAIWGGCGISMTRRTAGDCVKFRRPRTGAESANAHPRSAELGSKRFREACYISLSGGVNSGAGDREKASRRTDVENPAAAIRDHLWKQMTSNES